MLPSHIIPAILSCGTAALGAAACFPDDQITRCPYPLPAHPTSSQIIPVWRGFQRASDTTALPGNSQINLCYFSFYLLSRGYLGFVVSQFGQSPSDLPC